MTKKRRRAGLKPSAYLAEGLQRGAKIGDGLDYAVLLGVGEFRVDGEREDFPAGSFGLGKIAGGVAEIGECLLQVNAEGIVNFRGDPGRVEKCFQVVTA